MVWTLIAAGVLSAVMAAVHSMMGETLILRPLFKQGELPALFGSPTFARRTLRFTWHVTAVLLAGLGGLLILLGAAGAPSIRVLEVLSLTYFIAACVAAFGSGGKHFSWAVFSVISILVWIS